MDTIETAWINLRLFATSLRNWLIIKPHKVKCLLFITCCKGLADTV